MRMNMMFTYQLPLIQTAQEFEEEYERRINLPEYNEYAELFAAGVAYDAAWALAIGLSITAEKVVSNDVEGCENEFGELVPLEEFEYSNNKMGCLMIKSFSQVNFTGITVRYLGIIAIFRILKSIIKIYLSFIGPDSF